MPDFGPRKWEMFGWHVFAWPLVVMENHEPAQEPKTATIVSQDPAGRMGAEQQTIREQREHELAETSAHLADSTPKPVPQPESSSSESTRTDETDANSSRAANSK